PRSSPIGAPENLRPTTCAPFSRHARSHIALTTDVLARLLVRAPRLAPSRGVFFCPPAQLGGGNAIQRRSAMLRWHASAKATSRIPALKSDGIGSWLARWPRNRSQPTRYGLQ